MSFDLGGKRILVAGHRGMVCNALVHRLGTEPREIPSADRDLPDLTDSAAVRAWMRPERPDAMIVAEVVGCEAELVFDASKPDGTPRNPVDMRRPGKPGWDRAQSLPEGIDHTYANY